MPPARALLYASTLAVLVLAARSALCPSAAAVGSQAVACLAYVALILAGVFLIQLRMFVVVAAVTRGLERRARVRAHVRRRPRPYDDLARPRHARRGRREGDVLRHRQEGGGEPGAGEGDPGARPRRRSPLVRARSLLHVAQREDRARGSGARHRRAGSDHGREADHLPAPHRPHEPRSSRASPGRPWGSRSSGGA